MKVIWCGYNNNCFGTNPRETRNAILRITTFPSLIFLLTIFLSFYVNTVLGWTYAEMQYLADSTNSDVIVVEWGFNGVACYGYVQITFCLLLKIAEFFAYLLIKCGIVIETLDLIGHSFGVQVLGYVCQRLAIFYKRLAWRIIGLDPAGPFFGAPFRCQGIRKLFVRYSIVFHCNPFVLGTGDPLIGHVIIFVNLKCKFCQPFCECIACAGCCHSYCTKLYLAIIQKNIYYATYTPNNPLQPGAGAEQTKQITLDKDMDYGFYVVDTYNDTVKCPIISVNAILGLI